MKFKQTINSFSAWTVDRLTGARRATLTTLATFLIAMTAQTAWAESVSYIDASGNPQNAEATEITNDSGDNLASGWYVVKGNVTLNHHLNFTGNVNLILADGATLTITGSKVRTVNGADIYYGLSCESENGGTKYDLTIYGQLGGTGKISSSGGDNPTYSYDFFAQNITINGGVVEAKSTSRCIIATEKVTINGGQVSAVNGDIMAQGGDGTITLGWMKGADYIHAMYYKGTIVFAKQFIYWAYHNNGEPIAFATTDKGDNGYLINNYRIMPDVWGVAGGNDGSTAEKACTITNTEGLNHLAQCVNVGEYHQGKYFKLGDDITYYPTVLTIDSDGDGIVDSNFTTIGYRKIIDKNNPPIERPFRGHFDGNGKTISGINLNNSDVEDHGIFGYLYGTVKNLVVNNCSIVADHNIGAIVGVLYGTIENCHVGSDVTLSGHSHVGGIAGWCADATIKGCTSAATIKGITNSGSNADDLGGIVGATNGPSSSLTDNLFTGAITGDLKEYIGAIFGWGNEYATLTNNVYTSAGFGGIGAEGSATGADVAGARKAYEVTLGTYVSMDGTATAHGTVTNDGDISITSYANNSGIMYTTKSGGTTTSTIYAGATETIKLKYTGTVAEGCVVGYKVNDGEATAGNTITMPAADATITEVDMALWGNGDGSETNPYVITTTEGLDLLAQKVNAGTGYSRKFFKLGDNIAYDKNTANNFTPIGNNNNYFYGTFDGNGKTISGININRSGLNAEYQGVFGLLYGTVENLVVSNCSIVARTSVGAIAGYLGTATIENCSASNNVTLSGNSYVGGIVGASNQGTIKGCVSAATITGKKIGINTLCLGGIVGATTGSNSSSLTDNLFTGAITGDLGQYIGAIVGENPNGGLTNNVYTSAGFGGIGAEGSETGSDGAGAHKAVEIIAAEGVTITPTGTKTTYNVSGITAYTDNNFIGYDSKLYAGATTRAKLSITYTVPEGYIFDGIDAGEGVNIILNEGVYNLAVPASDVTVDVVYQAIIYNITYKGVEDEGVTFTEDNPEAYTVADESFALNNPSREGYLFMGWTYEGQDEPTKTVTIAMGSTGDKTFTANWEEFVETEVETAVINEAAKEVEITKVMVPKGETKAVIPATVNGYAVTNIAKGAFYYKTGEDHVQDIFLPDTKRLINIEEGALIFDKLMEPTLHVPLELLSDYANMPGLKIFFEADKIQAMAVAPNKFWTFSCGIDVKVPEGVKVYTCRMNDDKTAVLIHELTDDELGGVIKANNGVLLSSARGKYPFIVNHATATEVGKSYENNLLEPVLKAKNYASDEYYVLMDNEFHPIIANGSEVPACKAVLHWASSAKARLEIILGDDVKTAINGIAADEEGGEWYTISGQRIDKPTKKGLYIKNGKKVIIK